MRWGIAEEGLAVDGSAVAFKGEGEEGIGDEGGEGDGVVGDLGVMVDGLGFRGIALGVDFEGIGAWGERGGLEEAVGRGLEVSGEEIYLGVGDGFLATYVGDGAEDGGQGIGRRGWGMSRGLSRGGKGGGRS